MARIVLGLDADGVILDYLHGFMAYLRSIGVEPACGPDEVADWEMTGALPGWSHDQVMAAVADFSVHPDFGRIPAVPGAVDAVASIREEFGDVELVAITSAGTSPDTARLRLQNLEPFGFDDVHVLPLGASKKDHLSLLPRGSVFVDDLHRHVVAAEEAGVQGVLFRRPYNAAHSHANVISCWPQGRLVVSRLLSSGREVAPAA